MLWTSRDVFPTDYVMIPGIMLQVTIVIFSTGGMCHDEYSPLC